jgi:hypothetical protein
VEQWIECRCLICERPGFKFWPSQISFVITGFVQTHTILHSLYRCQNLVGRLLHMYVAGLEHGVYIRTKLIVLNEITTIHTYD